MPQQVISVGFEEFLEQNVKELTASMPWMKDKNLFLCEHLDTLKDFVDMALEKGICCLDFETTGLNTRLDTDGNQIAKIVGIALAYDVDNGMYVPLGHREGKEFNLDFKPAMMEIARLCKNCVIVVHNAKFDLQVLKNHGIVVEEYEKFEDTLILARLYDAGQKEIGLKHLSEKLINQPMIDFSQATGKSKRFDIVPPNAGYLYAASDAVCTLGLYEFFINQEVIRQQRAVYNLEKRVVPVVMQMEANLIKIDTEFLKQEQVRVTKRLEEIKAAVYSIVGREFNIGSTQQLGKLLFDEFKYEYPEKRKTASGQYMTDTKTLEKIQDRYPIVKYIIEYREIEKSLGTYVKNLLSNVDENGCIKLSFNQTGTDTGRFSSPGGRGLTIDGYSGVNIQSIPANYTKGAVDIRRAMVARPGYKIVAMDFSGEELRVAANLSGERHWIDEFLYGAADLHTATGRVVFHKEEISKAERQTSKVVNFLTLYGGGPRALAEQAKVSFSEAKRLLASFFEGLPQLRRWIEREKKRARKIKYAKTSFGRIRPLERFYNTGDPGLMEHADRCATNFLVQGACADIMKTVMVRVSNWIRSNNLQEDIRILITMHDELVFEIRENKLMDFIPRLNKIMCLRDVLQGVLEWPVPLTIDAEYGDSWHVDKDFFEEHPELREIDEEINFRSQSQVIASETPEPPALSEETPQIPETQTSSQIPETPNETSEPVSSQEYKQETVSDPSLKEDSVTEPTGGLAEVGNKAEPDSTELTKSVDSKPDKDLEKNFMSNGNLIYILKSRAPSNVRKINDIVLFLQEDVERIDYKGPIKNLKLRDREGNEFLVSDIKVPEDAFLALARYFGV